MLKHSLFLFSLGWLLQMKISSSEKLFRGKTNQLKVPCFLVEKHSAGKHLGWLCRDPVIQSTRHYNGLDQNTWDTIKGCSSWAITKNLFRLFLLLPEARFSRLIWARLLSRIICKGFTHSIPYEDCFPCRRVLFLLQAGLVCCWIANKLGKLVHIIVSYYIIVFNSCDVMHLCNHH
jgi:hypothetical protein